MENWIVENSLVLLIALAAASALLLITVVVLLVELRKARLINSIKQENRVDAELDRIDLQLSLDEQLTRLRIIRELHEVAVHDLSTIVGHAEGAGYASQQDPSAAVRSVSVIADTARNTLADLRRVMTAVQEGEAGLVPQPSLQSILDLFAVMEETGLVVTFMEVGEKFDVKQGAELSIYRILHECLSNALEYCGPGTEVQVTFTWTDDSLQVVVDDDGVRASFRRDGRDPDDPAYRRGYDLDDDMKALTGVVSGAGISEMRARTEMFGGVFKAHPVPGVGFTVSAVFPFLRYHNGIHSVNLGNRRPGAGSDEPEAGSDG